MGKKKKRLYVTPAIVLGPQQEVIKGNSWLCLQ